MRWLVFILLAALGWLLWKGLLRVKRTQIDEAARREASNLQKSTEQDARSKSGFGARPEHSSPEAEGQNQQDLPVQTMVSCAYCGAWSPKSLALKQQNQWFCDESHAKAKS
jgi:ribosomal protein L44E